MPSIKKKIFVRFAGLALTGAATITSAQSYAGAQGGVSLHYGIGEYYQRVTLNYEAPSIWTRPIGGHGGRLDLTPELGASYWWAQGSRSPGSVWQLDAIPMFRWWTNERFYLEAGIGATVFSHTRFAGETISSAFQFGDHIGLGLLLTPNHRLGVRYSHFSNADIKRPNPGLDLVQAVYAYQF